MCGMWKWVELEMLIGGEIRLCVYSLISSGTAGVSTRKRLRRNSRSNFPPDSVAMLPI